MGWFANRWRGRGWISEGTGIEYDGFLIREEKVVEAWNAFIPENQITR